MISPQLCFQCMTHPDFTTEPIDPTDPVQNTIIMQEVLKHVVGIELQRQKVISDQNADLKVAVAYISSGRRPEPETYEKREPMPDKCFVRCLPLSEL